MGNACCSKGNSKTQDTEKKFNSNSKLKQKEINTEQKNLKIGELKNEGTLEDEIKATDINANAELKAQKESELVGLLAGNDSEQLDRKDIRKEKEKRDINIEMKDLSDNEDCEQSAKEENERTARAEAKKIAYENIQQKALELAELIAKDESEKKAKEEAERKTKEEPERKEAELKEKEEAAQKPKEEAENADRIRMEEILQIAKNNRKADKETRKNAEAWCEVEAESLLSENQEEEKSL